MDEPSAELAAIYDRLKPENSFNAVAVPLQAVSS